MKNEEFDQIVFLTLIAGRDMKDDLLGTVLASGAQLVDIIYGKGTVKASYLQNALGLVPEINKVVITCVIAGTKAEALMRKLVETYEFDKPNTGVAFTVPIQRLSF